MNKNLLLALLFLSVSAGILAQIEQVSIGPEYSQQTFYSLTTGEVETIANDDWDIMFSAIGQQDAGVFLNESASSTTFPMQAFEVESNDWNSNISFTQNFVDSVALHNPLQNWTDGAFNSKKDPNSPFDYGWGIYNPQTNSVVGNKIFVIKKRDGSFIKFQIVSLVGGTYSCRIANLDGSSERTFEINKVDSNGDLVYFSLDKMQVIDIPIDYDLIFQRYILPVDAGDGTFINYNVTGVLLAPKVEAVVADGIDYNSVDYTLYENQYSTLPTTIGHEWKAFDFTSGWIIDEDRTHFVKLTDGTIYQLTFFDFEGSSTGTTTLERKLISIVSTHNDFTFDCVLYPNPTSDNFILKSDATEAIDIMLFNQNGQIVLSKSTTTNEFISIQNLPTGLYTVVMNSKGKFERTQLMIK